MKVEAVMTQIEAIGASEKEALKRSEATQKEIKELKDSTEVALKRGPHGGIYSKSSCFYFTRNRNENTAFTFNAQLQADSNQ
uniref:WEB family protein At5g55860 n=1 Tax=Tanacetum cinerariifolium TaxID=118510 RepID=A0A699HJK9_TANCI|nr:WEB family protein At5g55860 [Tanacetum cinerariifolium]